MSASEIGAAPPASAAMWFEDFRVGQRFASAERAVTAEDVARFAELTGDCSRIHLDAEYARSLGFAGPLAHGPLGIGIVFGLLHELRIVESTAIAMRDLSWRFLAPIVPGDAVRMELVVTRCRSHARRQAGVVNRHFRLLANGHSLVQEGTSSMLVRARDAAGASRHACATDFCSPAWAAMLAPALEANAEFLEATRVFDGTIGLRAGEEEVQLRLYKGQVLDTGRSAPLGATFTLIGSELAWTELAFAERNGFIAEASRGAFSISGSAYDYLRLTKAVVALWDEVRTLAKRSGTP